MKKIWLFGIIWLHQIFYLGACENNQKVAKMNMKKNQESYKRQRYEMVEEQIVARGIQDEKILNAMRKVPRHKFVAEEYQNRAYDDTPLPIGHGQTISQPYIVAYMTAQLQLTEQDTVLEIGTGSGYQAAVLSEIASSVKTMEIVPELGKQAESVLKELGYENVAVMIGNGYNGWPEYAPFDAIIVTAAPPEVPQTLLNQLEDGGTLIAPVGDGLQELVLITRKGDEYKRKFLIPVRFVPMTGEPHKK